MSIIPVGFGAQGSAGFQIANAVRLDGANDYFSRTPGSDGNLTTWVLTAWVKLGVAGAGMVAYASLDGNNFYYTRVLDDAAGSVNVRLRISGVDYEFGFSPRLRDTSAWQMLGLHHNHQQAAAADRVYLTLNGVRHNYSWGTMVPQNASSSAWNKAGVVHRIGTGALSEYFNGNISQVVFVDGTALTPSSFGETDATTGSWKPKAITDLTYGTNGFYLSFANTADLGNDVSGNGNDWTPNSLGAADAGLDTPTNNFCVINLLDRQASSAGSVTLSNGSLTATWTNDAYNLGTIFSSTGKWYWEWTCVSRPLYSQAPGIGQGWNTNIVEYNGYNGLVQGVGTGGEGTFATWGTGDVIGLAWDADAGTLAFRKNNTLVTTVTGIPAGSYAPRIYGNDGSATLNFGQRAFAYAPPTGFKALCTANLPAPSIKDPGKHMDVATYTGNGAARSITGLGFQPDFVWIKSRNNPSDNCLYDSVRGSTKMLSSNRTWAEQTIADTLTAFNSDGFALGSDTVGTGVNFSAHTYVAWCWKAGGAAVTNTDGTISSQVSANPTAGFSIVKYTGNGLTNQTVGHGLGAAPKFIIAKKTNGDHWFCYHAGIGATKRIFLNLNNVTETSSYSWNDTAPTATVFSQTNGSPNDSGATVVAYCWSEIEGFSKAFSYTGNGSNDGPYVACGFRPRYILWKRTDVANDWGIYDTARMTSNPMQLYLSPNNSGAEASNAPNAFDALAGGFKVRSTAGFDNASGGVYIGMAFAEYPFGGQNTTPGKAR